MLGNRDEEERRKRAREEPLDVRRRSDVCFVGLEVRNPIHQSRHLVAFPLWPNDSFATCTCTDFARRGLGTCKHIVISRLRLQQNPEWTHPLPEPPVERMQNLWNIILQRLEHPPVSESPSWALRYAGNLLWSDSQHPG